MRHNRPIGPDCGDSALTIYRGGMTLLEAGHQPVTNKTPRFRYLLPSGPDATGKLERIHRCRRDVQQATESTPPERHPSITLPRRGFGPYLHTIFTHHVYTIEDNREESYGDDGSALFPLYVGG